MKKIILSTFAAVAALTGSLSLTSCGCCTSDAPAPPLRAAPTFDGIVTPSK